jgi:hypothetical protein
MFNLTDLKNFDLNQLDPTKLDLTRFDVRNIELPKFDMPKFDASQLPSIDLGKLEMPAEVTRVAEFARDAAYVGLGAVVVTAKKADERRRELTDQVTAQVRKLVEAAA